MKNDQKTVWMPNSRISIQIRYVSLKVKERNKTLLTGMIPDKNDKIFNQRKKTKEASPSSATGDAGQGKRFTQRI